MDRKRLPYIARIVHARPRLLISAIVGASIIPFLPVWPLSTRFLIGWDVGIALYLILSYRLVRRETTDQIQRRAAAEDEGGFVILALTVAASLASLVAIGIQASVAAGSNPHAFQLFLAVATIVLSWFFTHTVFALHYAHEYYGERGIEDRGLKFPDLGKPDYWDFVYFSFVIGMTSQVSDVAVTCKPIRRLVTVHGILSFFFNIALLALTFNIAASAIQK